VSTPEEPPGQTDTRRLRRAYLAAEVKRFDASDLQDLLAQLTGPPEVIGALLDVIQIRQAAAEELFRRARAERAATEEAAREITAMREQVISDRAEAREQLAQAQFLLEEARTRQVEARARRRAARTAGDSGGSDLRPDPSTAQTPAELIAALREFRTWAGNPSLRSMSERCGGRPSASKMCTFLRNDELPDRLEMIEAVIDACGGSEDDRRRFATAWRRLVMKDRATAAVDQAATAGGEENPDGHPAGRLRAVSGGGRRHRRPVTDGETPA
jgi:hypothetical protein